MKEFTFSKFETSSHIFFTRKFITFIDEDIDIIVVEMENGKQIDAFYNPKERVILFGYIRPQMEM